jgi:hypothetical protein
VVLDGHGELIRHSVHRCASTRTVRSRRAVRRSSSDQPFRISKQSVERDVVLAVRHPRSVAHRAHPNVGAL